MGAHLDVVGSLRLFVAQADVVVLVGLDVVTLEGDGDAEGGGRWDRPLQRGTRGVATISRVRVEKVGEGRGRAEEMGWRRFEASARSFGVEIGRRSELGDGHLQHPMHLVQQQRKHVGARVPLEVVGERVLGRAHAAQQPRVVEGGKVGGEATERWLRRLQSHLSGERAVGWRVVLGGRMARCAGRSDGACCVGRSDGALRWPSGGGTREAALGRQGGTREAGWAGRTEKEGQSRMSDHGGSHIGERMTGTHLRGERAGV